MHILEKINALPVQKAKYFNVPVLRADRHALRVFAEAKAHHRRLVDHELVFRLVL